MLQLDQSRVNHAKPQPTPDSAPSKMVKEVGESLKTKALAGELENIITGYEAYRAGRRALGLTMERRNVLRGIRVNNPDGTQNIQATIDAVKSQIKKFPN